MNGIKVAAAIVGGSLLTTALIFLMVVGLVAWLGGVVGGIVSLSIVVVLLFAVIATVENLT